MYENFDRIKLSISRITGDADFNSWTKGELGEYINEAQRDYCERTKVLRSGGSITARANISVYRLPPSAIEIVRMENRDGQELSITTSDELQRSHGNNWREQTGTPRKIYFDLDGMGAFRLFPKLEADDNPTSQPTPFDSEEGAVVKILDEDGNPLASDSEEGALVDYYSEEDEVFFSGERGMVVQAYSDDSDIRVWYSRYPEDDIIEIKDNDALRYFALAKCYERDGFYYNPQKAAYYFEQYERRVNRQIGIVSSGFGATQTTKASFL